MGRGAALRWDRPHRSGHGRAAPKVKVARNVLSAAGGRTTQPVRKQAKKHPKIAFENKGLMNAISFVRETKSDIDWF